MAAIADGDALPIGRPLAVTDKSADHDPERTSRRVTRRENEPPGRPTGRARVSVVQVVADPTWSRDDALDVSRQLGGGLLELRRGQRGDENEQERGSKQDPDIAHE